MADEYGNSDANEANGVPDVPILQGGKDDGQASESKDERDFSDLHPKGHRLHIRIPRRLRRFLVKKRLSPK